MDSKMNDLMLDLETMGSGPNAAIVAVGAVMFDIEAGVIGERFYQVVDLKSAVRLGGEMDPGTVLWWLKQSDAARGAFAAEGAHIAEVLAGFERFISWNSTPERVRIWGNGALFDNVILASAYRNADLMLPWRFWNDRCYRTVKALYPDIKPDRVGTHHNAVDDAETQARHLIAMLKGDA